jgi:predicted membrane metal-binding protein
LHWAAALGFAVLFLAVAAGGGMIAMQRLKRLSPLRQTADTIKEDVAWAKQQLTHGAK